MALPLTPARQTLFRKYFTALFAAVGIPLLIGGGLEAWFGYRDQRDQLSRLLEAEARGAAARIETFVDEIGDQLGWMVHLPWTEQTEERRRIDALRLLRQVPAIVSLTLVDGAGKERLHVSRIGVNRIDSGTDLSGDAAVAGARSVRIWHGPVTYLRESEPFMKVAVAGNRRSVGIAVAEVNLKLIWDVVTAIRVGETGQAFVLDAPGRLIAHPNISLVLRGADDTAAMPLRNLRDAVRGAGGGAVLGHDETGRRVIAAFVPISGVSWTVGVKQPASEAFGPIYAALSRTGLLLAAGSVLAAGLAFLLARRMTGPIRLLEQGTERIGAGDFGHRIEIATGDELGRLAARFNEMADELKVSQERQHRIARLKRFLAPQVAEIVEGASDDGVLDPQRLEVVVVFGDLRGFTAFSARTEPDEVMRILGAYYEALGAVITEHEATLTNISGDGVMALVNAPVPCADPAARAVRMAIAMQRAIQDLAGEWRARGHAVGFGIGVVQGVATVGRVGSDSRLDYTAIGSCVNLAARLCAAAEDRQILVDSATAAQIREVAPLTALGARLLKGFEAEVAVFAVEWSTAAGLSGRADQLLT
jgi:class 3 adenylate cyclase